MAAEGGDRDYVYMSLRDMHKRISAATQLDEATENSAVQAVVRQLLTPVSRDAQELATQCVRPLVAASSARGVQSLALQLCKALTRPGGGAKASGAAVIPLKHLFEARQAQGVVTAAAEAASALLAAWANRQGELAHQLEVAEHLFALHGPTLSAVHAALVRALTALVGDAAVAASPALVAAAVRCLGALAASLQPDAVQRLLEQSCSELVATVAKAPRSAAVSRNLELVLGVLRGERGRLAPPVVASLLASLRAVSEALARDAAGAEADRERCLLALEATVRAYPLAAAAALPSLRDTLRRELAFDPNMADEASDQAADEEEGEEEGGEDGEADAESERAAAEEEEEEDDEAVREDAADEEIEEWNDEEDTSFVVRRGAVKLLAAVVHCARVLERLGSESGGSGGGSVAGVGAGSGGGGGALQQRWRRRRAIETAARDSALFAAQLVVERLGESQPHIRVAVLALGVELIRWLGPRVIAAERHAQPRADAAAASMLLGVPLPALVRAVSASRVVPKWARGSVRLSAVKRRAQEEEMLLVAELAAHASPDALSRRDAATLLEMAVASLRARECAQALAALRALVLSAPAAAVAPRLSRVAARATAVAASSRSEAVVREALRLAEQIARVAALLTPPPPPPQQQQQQPPPAAIGEWPALPRQWLRSALPSCDALDATLRLEAVEPGPLAAVAGPVSSSSSSAAAAAAAAREAALAAAAAAAERRASDTKLDGGVRSLALSCAASARALCVLASAGDVAACEALLASLDKPLQQPPTRVAATQAAARLLRALPPSASSPPAATFASLLTRLTGGLRSADRDLALASLGALRVAFGRVASLARASAEAIAALRGAAWLIRAQGEGGGGAVALTSDELVAACAAVGALVAGARRAGLAEALSGIADVLADAAAHGVARMHESRAACRAAAQLGAALHCSQLARLAQPFAQSPSLIATLAGSAAAAARGDEARAALEAVSDVACRTAVAAEALRLQRQWAAADRERVAVAASSPAPTGTAAAAIAAAALASPSEVSALVASGRAAAVGEMQLRLEASLLQPQDLAALWRALASADANLRAAAATVLARGVAATPRPLLDELARAREAWLSDEAAAPRVLDALRASMLLSHSALDGGDAALVRLLAPLRDGDGVEAAAAMAATLADAALGAGGSDGGDAKQMEASSGDSGLHARAEREVLRVERAEAAARAALGPVLTDALRSPSLHTRLAALSLLHHVLAAEPTLAALLVAVAPLPDALCEAADANERFVERVAFGPVTRLVDRGVDVRAAALLRLGELAACVQLQPAVAAAALAAATRALEADFAVREAAHSTLVDLWLNTPAAAAASAAEGGDTAAWLRAVAALRVSLGATAENAEVAQELERHESMLRSAARCLLALAQPEAAALRPAVVAAPQFAEAVAMARVKAAS